MVTSEKDKRINHDAELLTAAAAEAALVWNRYNAMLVAHGIVLATIGSITFGGSPQYGASLCGAFLGIVLAIPWCLVTSTGWSIEYALLDAVSIDTKDDAQSPYAVYLKWGSSNRTFKSQDAIWWSAHLVIVAFYLVYLALAVFAAFKLGFGLGTLMLIAAIIGVLLGWRGFRWALTQPSMWSRKNGEQDAPPNSR